MTGRVWRALVVLATEALPQGGAAAQSTAPSARPTLRAEWVAAPPTIDGRLDEPIWHTAAIASGFVQRTPRGGATASQRTEVRVAYDRHTIYVGVRNFDTAPDSIAQQLGRRDSDAIYSDWFSVGFDSYADRRTAFVFRVNPRGVLRDAYLSNDEREDPLWDAVWDVAARIDRGGINFSRDIARHGETSLWAPTPADAPGIVSGTLSPATLNDRLLRGGPLALRPANRALEVSVTSDDRRLLILSATAGHRRDASGQRAFTMEGSLDWRPVPQARVSVTPAYVQDATTDQYVQSGNDPLALAVFDGRRYVFANVRQREARLDTRVDWTFSPWLSLQLFLQPFASSGAFSRFKEFTTPRRFAFAEYGAARGTVSV